MDILFILLFFINALLLIVNAYTLFPLIFSPFLNYNASNFASKEIKSTPKISILLPAYKEEKNIIRCVNSVKQINYPADKLEVIIATELEDIETTKAAKRLAGLSSRYGFQIKNIVVKKTPEPKGKPRALNQALEFATGEIVGVLDAEDIVDPELCKNVVSSILGNGFDGVQGSLDMANDYDGWLNLQFRAEYGNWYKYYLPSLNKLGYPFPFGGTTNFFNAEVLRRIGSWDSFNLTEDFELGMRFYASGKKVGMINSTTREESPTSLGAWLRQRTRWQRGKIQTLKKLVRASKNTSIKKRMHMIMTCLVPHVGVLNIVGIVLTLYLLFAHIAFPIAYLSLWLPNLMIIIILCYLHGNGYLIATKDEYVEKRLRNALFAGATLPLYWILHMLADLRAIKQEFFDKRIVWEKTEHGMRHMGVQGFYRRSGIIPILKKAGFNLKLGKEILGTSGEKHRFDIYGTYADTKIVVHGLEAPQQVSENQVAELVSAARDVRADQVLIVASPQLSKDALKIAKSFGIHAIETKSLNYVITLSMPKFGKLRSKAK